MQEQTAIQNLLRKKLAEGQKGNPGYSLRAYARKVGVHVGALTYIINGKRNVSKDLAERIVRKLLLDPQERSEILGLFPDKVPKPKPAAKAVAARYLRLNADQFKAVAEWEHFGVMSLARCEDFDGEEASIAQRLGLTAARTQIVIKRLLELGMIVQDENGKLSRSEQAFSTTDDVLDVSIQKHHEQALDMAKESLAVHDVGVRDFTSLTMAIDIKKLSIAKERIRKFQDELSDLLESGHQTEVFRLSMQLFPLSKLQQTKVTK